MGFSRRCNRICTRFISKLPLCKKSSDWYVSIYLQLNGTVLKYPATLYTNMELQERWRAFWCLPMSITFSRAAVPWPKNQSAGPEQLLSSSSEKRRPWGRKSDAWEQYPSILEHSILPSASEIIRCEWKWGSSWTYSKRITSSRIWLLTEITSAPERRSIWPMISPI